MFGRENSAKELEEWGSSSYSFVGPNYFPLEEAAPNFKLATMSYFSKMWALSKRLLHLLAMSASLPPTHFDSSFECPNAVLRYIRYLPVPSRVSDGIFAATPHCDYGMFTILLTSSVPGLEVLRSSSSDAPDDIYVPVAPLAGAFIVNLGEMLQVATGGEYKATKHRVVIDGAVERFSVPFFFEPSMGVRLKHIDVHGGGRGFDGGGLLSAKGGSLEEKTFAEHLKERTEESRDIDRVAASEN